MHKMADFSHWDFAETFSGQDAAALIIGLDPILDDLATTAPVLQRMDNAYTATLWAHQDAKHDRERWDSYNWSAFTRMDQELIFKFDDQLQDRPYRPKNLHSWRMQAYYNEASWRSEFPSKIDIGIAELANDRFKRWLIDDLRNGFDYQLFDRYELARWLDATELNSAYCFYRAGGAAADTPVLNVNTHKNSERRDLLTPVIEHAQSLCRNQGDTAQVWARLQFLAREKYVPLIGIDESGIQYVDANDRLKNLNYRALRMRLTRARQGTAEQAN